MERDFIGYANRKLDFSWPAGKRLALSIVVNYEEGAEHSFSVDGIVEGIGEAPPISIPARDVANEACYEYGSRVGVWRILNLLNRYHVKATFFAVAEALEKNPMVAKAIVDAGHEICDHGLRWNELYRFDYDEEKEMIKKSVEIIERVTGKKPRGFFAREPSVNTTRIVHELGNFIYDSATGFNDDLPYRYGQNGILILPYTPDANDYNFMYPMQTFVTSSDFLMYLKDTFDVLRDESRENPKMMSVGLHCRVIGRPGRFVALQRFLDYVKDYSDVWCATREDIANYWIKEVENHVGFLPIR